MRSLWKLRSFAHGMLPIILIALPMMAGAAWLNVRALTAIRPVLESISAMAGMPVLETPPGGHSVWSLGSKPAQRAPEPPAAKPAVKMTPAEREAAMRRVVNQALIFVLLTIAAALANSLSLYMGDYIGQRLLRRLRNAVFSHLQSLSMSFFDRRRSGELISRVNNDTAVLQRALGADLFKVIVAPLVILFMVMQMVQISLLLTLILAVALPITGVITAFTARYARRYGRRTQMRMADLTAVTQENFAAARVIKIFGLEPQAQKRFDEEAGGVLKAELKTALVKALGLPPVFGIIALAMAVTLVFGGYEILQGRVDMSALVLFMVFLQVAAAELTTTARLYVVLQLAEAAAERTLAVLAEVPAVGDAPDAIELEAVEGRVTFDHVDFSYDDGVPVLSDFSLDIAPGEVVALAGPSGAGKSTVANLVPRLYDAQSGSVQLDGIDVRQVKQSSLKRVMGSVPQETILFGATVRENIAYGREGATEEEIVEAARAAYAHDFIVGLPEGYDTQVGERGVRLSGGQRQRIAIARAFLRDPRVLILDEATSSLDNESEAAIHAALTTLLQGRTALIIAHRLSTIRNADRIIVMAEGRIAEQGGHDELMQKEGLYRRLYESRELLSEDASPGRAEPAQAPAESETLLPDADEDLTDVTA